MNLIMGLGVDYTSGELLFDPVAENEFNNTIERSLQSNAPSLAVASNAARSALTYRSELERERLDYGDPRSVGWTFLVNENDRQVDEIVRVIRPLAEHRRMEKPDSPLVYHGEGPDEWEDWMDKSYRSLDLVLEAKQAPHYILIVGGPEQVPFHFQAFLDTLASVGRVDFNTLDDLSAYIEKVIRLENAAAPVVSGETVFFAPDDGPLDATHFSRHYMAAPLAEYVRAKHQGLKVHSLWGEEATKEQLVKMLRGTNPALVYTASHGVGAKGADLETQKRVNGAICCQRVPGDPLPGTLFTADDVPLDEPFLEGAIFFQFACYGYGTPAESDYKHWVGDKVELNAEQDFVAALPKRLLAHPRGPIGFIGHVDTAWLHGFQDPDDIDYHETRWGDRMTPFLRAVIAILGVQPTGQAMQEINSRYVVKGQKISRTYDRVRRGALIMDDELRAKIATDFIEYGDAQNYMIFGDPGVHLRIPAP